MSALVTCLLTLAAESSAMTTVAADSTVILPDSSLTAIHADSIDIGGQTAAAIVMKDMTEANGKRRDWATWRPNPKRAMWLAIVIPGAGQIYNRKYWKIPIVYGGFVGCAYALRWNNQMYKDYSQAYLDIMDDDPNTQSYNQFLHLGNKIDESNIQRYQNLFKKRKDKFRRWRDMSVFCLIGVYALSIIDAYVDASLSEFDISKDLSMKIEPAVMGDERSRSPFKHNALGVNCSITF